MYPPIQILISQEGVEYRQLGAKRESCQLHDNHVWDTLPSNYASVLQTCRQIYIEAADLLYSDTLFLVDIRIPGQHAHRRREIEELRHPIELGHATLLKRVKHLHLTIRIRRSSDFWNLGDILATLPTMLNANLKSAAIFVSFRNIHWGTNPNNVNLEQWQHLLASIKRLDLKYDTVPLSLPRWLKPGNKRFQELEQATNGHLKVQKWSGV